MNTSNTKYIRSWFTSGALNEAHRSLPVRQVYLWFVTKDLRIAIVGRAKKWQFPGGKPEGRESTLETLNREAYEEAGIILQEYARVPEMFGYYLVENDTSPNWQTGKPYLQLRYFLHIDNEAEDIHLSVNEKDGETDKIEAAIFVDLYKLNSYIDWVNDNLDEYIEVKRRVKLNA